MGNNVIWQPQPRQAVFMSRSEYEALYGGAAGGGKSDAIIIEALRQVHIPHYKALILRKTFPQLAELIDKSLNYYPRAFPKARYNGSNHTWTFPSGAKIIFGSMQYTKDRTKYQGQAYDFIAFDELTHFTWEEYSYMFSRNRPNGPGTRVYIRASANPGGVGHGWVKERFITAAKPMQTVTEDVVWRDPGGREHSSEQTRIFVPSSVFDNPALLDNDPQYVQRLASLPEADRNALLYGDWDTFSGQVFTEWRNDHDHYADRVNTHVITPFPIPKDWVIWCGLDWGYSRPFSVGWYAVDHENRIYRIAEFYGCTATPNEGVKYEPAKLAECINEVESLDPNLKGKHIIGIADPAIFSEEKGESIGETMARHGIYFDKADNTRLAGKMQCHYRLSFDENGIPMFYVFNTCKHFIRTIPQLLYDEKKVEDIDTEMEDHCLIGSTLVWTENGKVPISELVGTTGRVLSSDGKYHQYADVRLTQRNVKVYTIELEDGSKVTATANHRFKLRDGSWKRLDELREDDELWQM